MKIWFDLTPFSQFAPNEDCSRDHNTDCSTHAFDNTDLLPDGEVLRQALHRYTLRQVPSLYSSPCGSERWLLCNVAQSGIVVVADRSASALLDLFRTPTKIDVALQSIDACSIDNVTDTIALFFQLGLLEDVEQPISMPVIDKEECLSTWLHITNDCPLRCPGCYLHKTSEHMVDDTIRRALDAVFRSARSHGFKRMQLKYAGGEASLQMPNVLAAHDYAARLAQQHDIQLYAYIMSNGVVLPQRSIDRLKERHIDVMISLDGVGDVHDSQRPFISGKGSFEYVDRTIARLLASNLRPHINVTVSQRNLAGLPDLTNYILERDLPFTFSYYRDNDCSTHLKDLQFADVQMIEGMQKAFRVIEQRLPQHRLIDSLIDKASMRGPSQHTCGVGRNYMVIDQRGQIAKCHADIKQTMTTIDAPDPLQVIRLDKSGVQAVPVEEKEGCRSCEWRHWCTGGCPLLTYRMTGRNDVKSPNCHIYKALFPEALRLEALRLLKYAAPVVFEDERVLLS